jgi:hypothetical protein
LDERSTAESSAGPNRVRVFAYLTRLNIAPSAQQKEHRSYRRPQVRLDRDIHVRFDRAARVLIRLLGLAALPPHRCAPAPDSDAGPVAENRRWHGACCTRSEVGWPMVQGLITSKDILWHGGSIVRSYGFRPYLRCLRALFSGRSTTFLELIWAANDPKAKEF